MEAGQVSLILTGMNTEVMTMIEYLPEIGQEKEILSAQILLFSFVFENPWATHHGCCLATLVLYLHPQ